MRIPSDDDLSKKAEPYWEDNVLQERHKKAIEDKKIQREGFPIGPIIFIFLAAALAFGGGIYFAKNTSQFDPLTYVPEIKTVEEEGNITPEEALKRKMAKGKKVFAQNCKTCHQENGQGIPGVYPSLVQSKWIKGNEQRSIAIVIQGLMGEIEVLGKKYNGVMAPLGNLSDKKIASVLTYIRMNEKWSNNASEVTEEQVKTTRERHSSRTNYWTGKEILELYPLE